LPSVRHESAMYHTADNLVDTLRGIIQKEMRKRPRLNCWGRFFIAVWLMHTPG
jgi:hypothetical protein